MARQRNDLQRLQEEIRHELDKLARNGALQAKIDGLKSKLQDVTTRRGAAPGAPIKSAGSSSGSLPQTKLPAAPQPPPKKDGLMGRLFG